MNSFHSWLWKIFLMDNAYNMLLITTKSVIKKYFTSVTSHFAELPHPPLSRPIWPHLPLQAWDIKFVNGPFLRNLLTLLNQSVVCKCGLLAPSSFHPMSPEEKEEDIYLTQKHGTVQNISISISPWSTKAIMGRFVDFYWGEQRTERRRLSLQQNLL